jgi:hypothetical protein
MSERKLNNLIIWVGCIVVILIALAALGMGLFAQ